MNYHGIATHIDDIKLSNLTMNIRFSFNASSLYLLQEENDVMLKGKKSMMEIHRLQLGAQVSHFVIDIRQRLAQVFKYCIPNSYSVT